MAQHEIPAAQPSPTPQQRSLDAFCELDERLTRENRAPDVRSPQDVTLSEKLAVRILVKHYGWVALDANTLRRHRK
jgi:hypothetical protein